MLDDRARALGGIRINGEQRTLEIEEIVERELLSASLHERRQSRAGKVDVERRRLIGILSVTQLLLSRDG